MFVLLSDYFFRVTGELKSQAVFEVFDSYGQLATGMSESFIVDSITHLFS